MRKKDWSGRRWQERAILSHSILKTEGPSLGSAEKSDRWLCVYSQLQAERENPRLIHPREGLSLDSYIYNYLLK